MLYVFILIALSVVNMLTSVSVRLEFNTKNIFPRFLGVFTGSVYKDFALLRNGFPAESVTNGRVLVVKTHESGSPARSLFEKAILLVRKPSEAILAEFNRRAAGHIGHAGRDKYTRNAGRCA